MCFRKFPFQWCSLQMRVSTKNMSPRKSIFLYKPLYQINNNKRQMAFFRLKDNLILNIQLSTHSTHFHIPLLHRWYKKFCRGKVPI